MVYNKPVMFLRNHGMIVAGKTVAQAYDDLYYLERAAMVQVMANRRPAARWQVILDPGGRAHRAPDVRREPAAIDYHFAALKRLLDRDELGWRRLAA